MTVTPAKTTAARGGERGREGVRNRDPDSSAGGNG